MPAENYTIKSTACGILLQVGLQYSALELLAQAIKRLPEGSLLVHASPTLNMDCFCTYESVQTCSSLAQACSDLPSFVPGEYLHEV